jgi:anti-sigma factor RsiW
MICERVKEQLAEYLSGNLEGPAREKLVCHLEQCPRCQAEVEELGSLWRSLDFLPSAQPGIAMRRRFNEMLEAYRFGQAEVHSPATSAKCPSPNSPGGNSPPLLVRSSQ